MKRYVPAVLVTVVCVTDLVSTLVALTDPRIAEGAPGALWFMGRFGTVGGLVAHNAVIAATAWGACALLLSERRPRLVRVAAWAAVVGLTVIAVVGKGHATWWNLHLWATVGS